MNEEMSEHDTNDETETPTANPRRDFLKSGATATGALIGLSILGVSAVAAHADEHAAPHSAASDKAASEKISSAPSTLQLSLKEHKALATIGGSEIIAVPAVNDTLIIARTDAANFAACSAICPHRGCKVEYDHEGQEFLCPCHNSRFALDGKVLKGPAKKPLKNYATDLAAVVSLNAPPAPTTKKVS